MKTYRKYRKWILALGILAVMSVTISQKKPLLYAAPSSNTLIIAVSQTPLSAPFFIAQEMGIFKHYGLTIELQPCIGGAACAKSLFDHKVDLATASESVVMFNAFKQTNFKIITSFVESDNDLKLLTLLSNNIQSIHDLTGKKIGVVKASSSEFYLDTLLIVNHIQPSTIKKIYLLPQQLKDQLLTLQVDAISSWEPIGYETEMQSSSKLINLGIPGIYQLSFNLLANTPMSATFAEQNIRLLQALDEAIAWINNNPTIARTITAKQLNLPIEQLEWSWHDYAFRLSLGNALLSNLQLQARWAIETKVEHQQMPSFRDLFATDLLRQAISRKVL
jgi:sulfonate transport system substrate-binding protein